MFEVVGLAAGGNIDLLAKQIKQHKPQIVSVRDSEGLARLRDALSGWTGPMPKIVCGEEVRRLPFLYPSSRFPPPRPDRRSPAPAARSPQHARPHGRARGVSLAGPHV